TLGRLVQVDVARRSLGAEDGRASLRKRRRADEPRVIRSHRRYRLGERALGDLEFLGTNEVLAVARGLDARVPVAELGVDSAQVRLAHVALEVHEHRGAGSELDARAESEHCDQDERDHTRDARDREEVAARVDQVDLPHRAASVDAAVLGTSTNQSWLRAIRVPIRSRIKVRVTMIAENIDTSTPT